MPTQTRSLGTVYMLVVGTGSSDPYLKFSNTAQLLQQQFPTDAAGVATVTPALKEAGLRQLAEVMRPDQIATSYVQRSQLLGEPLLSTNMVTVSRRKGPRRHAGATFLWSTQGGDNKFPSDCTIWPNLLSTATEDLK